MSGLHEYEVTEKDGSITTLQLSDDDAKRLPHARKVGAHSEPKAETETAAPKAHRHEPVHHRARRTG
jgi:hypothetical protein